VQLGSTVFQAAPAGSAIAAAVTVGTRVSFTLSEPGTVRFTVERPGKGRKVSGRCARPRPANRKRVPCVRWTPLKGSAATPGRKGANRVTFRGRMGGKTLRPGRYRLVLRVTDVARNTARARALRFRIVR
jgi:hypothetical protein